MRLFEWILIIIVLVSILLRFFRFQKAVWIHLFPLASFLVIGYHFFTEGLRWQMIPFYVFAVSLSVPAFKRITNPEFFPKRKWTIVWLVLSILLVFLPVLLPVPRFPLPTGPYPVGTTSFYWVDETREEIYAEQPGTPRRVMVQVWYPAALNEGAQTAPYNPDGVIDAQAMAQSFGFPKFFLSHLALSETQAYVGEPLAQCFDTWPVLVFSHGWSGMRYQNTAQAVELASQGYIVFAPEHAYGAILSVYPDGEIIYNYPEALPKGVSDEEYVQAARLLGQSWVGDLRFTLDQLEHLQSGEIPSWFTGHLNLEKIGLFGHSTGGGAVLETCWLDSRCQAVFTEDPWLVPYDRQIPLEGLTQPTVLMHSEAWVNQGNQPLLKQLWENEPPGTVKAEIAGTAHYDFSDMPLYSPIGYQVGLKGPIPAERITALLNDYLTTFFNQHLMEGKTSLQDLSSRYPEVNFAQK